MDDLVVVSVANTQYEVITEVTNEMKWKVNSEPGDMNFDIFWQDNALTPDQLSQLKPYQRINHFPGMYAVARKDHLGKNLKAMKYAFPNTYNYFPPTWVLPKDLADLKNQFNEKRAKTFICKPEASSQGKGIFLTRKLEEIPERCVVQRYLHKPYLIDGLKFDLRVYVLILGCDPLRMFIHKEGLVRLATEPYTSPMMNNLGEVCMHLTNYAINKNSSKFQFNQNSSDDYSGHKRSLSKFIEKLKEKGENTEALWADISDMIVKTMCVAQPLLAHLYRSSQPNDPTNSICFQILGFDIFLDNKLKPYLLEVNHTPSFTTDTPLDLHVKKAVIGDALRMLGMHRRSEIDIKSMRNNRGMKEIRSLRLELKEKWMQSRTEIEEQFRGGYTRIFPANKAELYEEYMHAARDVWLTNLGIRKKESKDRTQAKSVVQPSLPPTTKILKPIGTPNVYYRKSNSPLFNKSIKNFYPPPMKKQVQKLPAIKLAYGSFIQPRLFDFNDSGHTIVPNREQEKQG